MAERAGAERMRPLLASLGDPQRDLRVVHVGGTNGKGSVCAMLASILERAGHRVGRYTSPHLESFTERIRVGGADIAQRAFEGLMAEIRAAARHLEARGALAAPYSEFDLLTAGALHWFRDQRADIAIVEVGVGGLHDATNVFDEPLLTILTNVSLDHTDVLGADEELIARAKSGIIRAGRPVLTQAAGRPFRVIQEAARALRSHLKRVDCATFVAAGPGGQRYGYRGRMGDLGLLGSYQLQNVALVLDAVESLRAEGLAVPDDAVQEGLQSVSWPGRMESWQGGGGRWLFDGAHNPAGAAELAVSVRRHFPGEEPVVVFGALRGKPGSQMVRQLAPLARTMVLTAPPSDRALAPAELAAGLKHDDLRIVPEPRAALAEAAKAAGERIVLVCGSLYLVGLARAWARSASPET
ncbi:MAG: bifunctional folylpolyglutamate synthase/dihydrofolate synthase [Candidatus Sericytochromatia bacterium]|nr:bifunctional folylpolyglutamate synthase/dihydrofolate synthase [Candidatus Tanganyikabacteria bacterium]